MGSHIEPLARWSNGGSSRFEARAVEPRVRYAHVPLARGPVWGFSQAEAGRLDLHGGTAARDAWSHQFGSRVSRHAARPPDPPSSAATRVSHSEQRSPQRRRQQAATMLSAT